MLDLCLCRAGASIGDVFGQRAVKQDWFLLHDSNLRSERSLCDFGNVLSINLDGAATHIVETLDELDESRLARTRMTDQTNPFTGFNPDREVAIESRVVTAIMEGDVLKRDLAISDLDRVRTRPVGNAVRLGLDLNQLLHIVDRTLQVADMHTHITQIALQHEECRQNEGDITRRCLALAPEIERKSNDNATHHQQVYTLNEAVQRADQPCAACPRAPLGDDLGKTPIFPTFRTESLDNSVARNGIGQSAAHTCVPAVGKRCSRRNKAQRNHNRTDDEKHRADCNQQAHHRPVPCEKCYRAEQHEDRRQ